MKESLKSIATNYGLYLGIALLLLTVLSYAVDLSLMTNMWFGLFILLVTIAFGIISVAKVKQAQNGFTSFKEAFSAYFITVVIGLLISTFVSYLLFNVIDTDAANTIKEQTIEKTVEMLEKFNTPNNVIAQSVEQIEEQDQYSLLNLLKSLAGSIVLFCIIGLIVSAALKKNNPDAE